MKQVYFCVPFWTGNSGSRPPSPAIPTAIASENGRFAPENWNAREVQSPRQPLAQQPRDAICGKRASRPCPARQADATGPLPHPCLAETPTPRPGTVRPRQTAWLSRLDRSSLSLPRRRSPPRRPVQTPCRWSRSAPMIASQSVAAARLIDPPGPMQRQALHQSREKDLQVTVIPPRRQLYVEKPTAQLRVGSASPAGLRERRHRSARCRARWRGSAAAGGNPLLPRRAGQQ